MPGGGASGETQPRIPMTGLRLPRLAGLEVQTAAPLPLAQLRGDQPLLPPGEEKLVPVPVIPPEC